MASTTSRKTSSKRKLRKRKARRPKLSKEQLARNRADKKFRTDINTIFTNGSFKQIPTRNVQLKIEDRQGDFDSFFVYENILVFVEDTTAKNGIKEHIGKSADFFKHVNNNPAETLKVLSSKFPKFRPIRSSYNDADYHFVFVYCSRHQFDRKYESRHPNLTFLRYSNLQYFLSLSKTIGASVRFELFKFLQLELSDIGIQQQGESKREYRALMLPESPSGFPQGHKIVSFLIEPQTLLEQAYVLRKDGWQDSDCLYQRLIVKGKIGKMREYLATEGRVFVNNIIATLPDDTQFLDMKGRQIDHEKLFTTDIVKVELKRRFGTIGLVDGQHRVFAYHEGRDNLDKRIGMLRQKQHLLVTGIVYPPGTSMLARTQFEAKLFLEINDKQTRTKGDLKQAIETIVDPFSDIAIAKKVVSRLAESGPLCGYLEEHFFDKGKIKTTSIVSYGMRHIVAIDGEDSFYGSWKHPDKAKLKARRNKTLLDAYVDYCSSQLSAFIGGLRQVLPGEMWSTDRKISRALTTTTINGLIFCMRQIIQDGKVANAASYAKAFKRCKVDFTPDNYTYRSSHWRDLGNTLYDMCFK